jgi:hypothetical protein
LLNPFWQEPLARVTTHVSAGSRKYPSIEAEDDALLIFFRLSKAGYGSVNEIEQWSVRKVLQCLCYEKFCSDYEDTYIELNKN